MSTIDNLSSVADWESYFDSFKDHLAPLVHDTGENLAVTGEFPTVHPEQTAWARQMRKGIYMPVDGKVYVAVGYELCSPTMIVGDDGVIVIDPGENDDAAAAAMADLRRFSDLPVRAVIYTHRHPDHAFATDGLGVTADDVRDGRVDIIAHESFEHWLVNDSSVVGPILTARSSQAMHSESEPPGKGPITGALGPSMAFGPMSTYLPTITTGDSTDLTIAGVRMTVFHAYGDAQDEIDVWFPDLKHVHGSETIQGETFPNLYTLRGTSYRDPEQWYQGVDHLRRHALQADSYSGSHMRPWVGNAFIVERITNYRDAIQFVYDQSIRQMNKGATGPELVELVAKRLPDHLRDDPWLQPYYGTPEHSVRNIYNGMLGWFPGDATELAAPLHVERAQLYTEAMGGRQSVLDQARAAVEAGKYGWAAELTTHLVRTNLDDTEARSVKAEALRRWGYDQKNIYWRTFALSAAMELEDRITSSHQMVFAPPAVVNALPVTKVVEGLRVRLDAEKAADVELPIGFRFTDTSDQRGMRIRRGVMVVEEEISEDAQATVVTTAAELHRVIGGSATLAQALEDGSITVEGSAEALHAFLGYLDPHPTEPVRIALR
ncbi:MULTISPECIES: alkyl sulfatase dimerization domain-containing protein [unclassified Isoptericola]|uniref:alkyl sulfatase dimerization domain-containing protein n=1 Tax=unclassified Isoptericola TaxID=2623355 RepID=UPI003669F71E